MVNINRYLKIFLSIILAITVIIPFSFTNVNAAEKFNFYLDKPQTGDNSGYIVLLLENKSSGAHSIQVIQWFTMNNTNGDVISNDPYVNVIVASNKLTLTTYAKVQANVSIIWWKGASYEVTTASATSTSTHSKSFSYSSYNIIGYKVEGNIGTLSDQLTGAKTFEVDWGASDSYTTELQNLVSELTSQGTVLDTISNNISNIKSTISNLKTIISEQNSILTSIWNEFGQWTNSWSEFCDNLIEDMNLGFDCIVEAIIGNGNNDVNNNISDKNNEFNNTTDEYLELEDTFQTNLNDSLNNIDLNVELFNGGQFLNAANFISTNINRIVTSNPYYESFIMTGLVFGLALFLIGKRVI